MVCVSFLSLFLQVKYFQYDLGKASNPPTAVSWNLRTLSLQGGPEDKARGGPKFMSDGMLRGCCSRECEPRGQPQTEVLLLWAPLDREDTGPGGLLSAPPVHGRAGI